MQNINSSIIIFIEKFLNDIIIIITLNNAM